MRLIDADEFMKFVISLEETGAPHVSFDNLRKFIDEQPKIGEWIPCSERMPEEHETMFAKLKGTYKWRGAMFESMSDDVNATVEFEDGSRKTMTLHTCDGEWKTDLRIVKFKVIAWQPLPNPCIVN